MGVISFFSGCSHSDDRGSNECMKTSSTSNVSMLGNPNPANFVILCHESIGRFLVVMIEYPECQNYEGKKILIFEHLSVQTLTELTFIDPHFCDSNEHPSPVARFEPTDDGWQYAVLFCKQAALQKKKR